MSAGALWETSKEWRKVMFLAANPDGTYSLRNEGGSLWPVCTPDHIRHIGSTGTIADTSGGDEGLNPDVKDEQKIEAAGHALSLMSGLFI